MNDATRRRPARLDAPLDNTDNAPVPGNLDIDAMLHPGDYPFDEDRDYTVGQLVDEVCEKLRERLGREYTQPPVFAANGQLYTVAVCVRAVPATQYEIDDALAGMEFIEEAVMARAESLAADDL